MSRAMRGVMMRMRMRRRARTGGFGGEKDRFSAHAGYRLSQKPRRRQFHSTQAYH
jgi:hypothetical protein